MEVRRDIGRKTKGEVFYLWEKKSSVLNKIFLTIFIFTEIKTKY